MKSICTVDRKLYRLLVGKRDLRYGAYGAHELYTH